MSSPTIDPRVDLGVHPDAPSWAGYIFSVAPEHECDTEYCSGDSSSGSFHIAPTSHPTVPFESQVRVGALSTEELRSLMEAGQ